MKNHIPAFKYEMKLPHSLVREEQFITCLYNLSAHTYFRLQTKISPLCIMHRKLHLTER